MIDRAREALLRELRGIEIEAAERAARAVLEACREPTPDMTETGGFICFCGGSDREASASVATKVWQAMFDAAMAARPPRAAQH